LADSIYFEVVRTPGFDRKKAQEEANKRLTSKKNTKENTGSLWSVKTILLSVGLGLGFLASVLFLFFRKRSSNNEIEVKHLRNKESKGNENTNVVKHETIKHVNFDSEELETLLNSPSQYINCLSEKMDSWLNKVTSNSKIDLMSRIEKLDVLSTDPVWSEHAPTVRSIFQKIDEARYGLPVDRFYCQQIQEKLQSIFNK
jgi:uncharacterized protein HemX